MGVAVGLYFGLRPLVGSEEVGWMCILGAESYTGSDLYHRSSEMVEEGAKVLIWYDPAHPNRCSYHKPGPGLDPYGVYFLMIPLAIAWFGKNRRKESSGLL